MKYLIILMLLTNSVSSQVIDTSTGKSKSATVNITFTVDKHDNEFTNQDNSNIPADQETTDDYKRMLDL